jgi:hypothetical protein
MTQIQTVGMFSKSIRYDCGNSQTLNRKIRINKYIFVDRLSVRTALFKDRLFTWDIWVLHVLNQRLLISLHKLHFPLDNKSKFSVKLTPCLVQNIHHYKRYRPIKPYIPNSWIPLWLLETLKHQSRNIHWNCLVYEVGLHFQRILWESV